MANKKKIKDRAFKFLAKFDKKIKTKFSNISNKTGQYNVPSELFQKRTPRKNRVLISWKTVKKNSLTIEQLNSFSGGVAVEFVNEDFFNEANQKDPLFIELKKRLGSDENVASIISIRSESGSSSSAIQRSAFQQLINNTVVNYKNNEVTINENNYKDYAITKNSKGGIGNEKWSGFLFVSIRGGQQDTLGTHQKNITVFNPACEYANEDVCMDLDIVMSYFALKSIQKDNLNEEDKAIYDKLILDVEEVLISTSYENPSYNGNLLDYCRNHPSIKMVENHLYDPIQVQEIQIGDFAIDNKEDPRNLDFTHDEAVNNDKYYWDTEKNCILSAARPTNVFWSKHLSNMMQQNFSLTEYFEHEENIIKRRKELLGQN